VALARALGVPPVGTMGHEYLQAYQALGVRLRDSQTAALEDWVKEYRGDLGIALTDVIGMAAFLADFDLYFAKLFDGLRHDSGDPVAWGEQALAHYARLGVDPHTKRLVFSDGLDITRALGLHRHFADRVPVVFGIGTHLTNDLGPEPLQVVMKLVRVNGQPVAKISDSPGKTQCEDATFLAYLRQVFGVRG
jgi:nicotinate phosphoribosyltransferase